MNFLEANRILREYKGGPSIAFLLAMSGTPDPLTLYLRAAAAKRGCTADVNFLAFNTLQQAVVSAEPAAMPEIFVLLPWDLVTELDWRTGVTSGDELDEQALLNTAEAFIQRVINRRGQILFVPATSPPLWLEPARNQAFVAQLEVLVRSARGTFIADECFSLGSYLTSGAPFGGAALGTVAEAVIDLVRPPLMSSAKVLVTDLDETMWAGIIGDDGVAGIAHNAEGKGYPHFIYQTMLQRLRQAGVLLAAVSKNDADTALAPFKQGEMVLKEHDFVAILASWNAKSSQIKLLAEQLNLGLDAFVFVDDNPVELAEVARELPLVHCLRFPRSSQELPAMLDSLLQLFQRGRATAEDQERTQLYRRRLEGMAPSDVAGADLTQFLRDLEMKLVITDRSQGDRSRAVQLLNKTNQFNANGRRFSDEEVQAVIDAGGRLYAAALSDRTGNHGEILVALLDHDGVIRALVMSCRVFQRRVEFAVLSWLATSGRVVSGLEYSATDRNEPFQRFLKECLGEEPVEGLQRLEKTEIDLRFTEDRLLCQIREVLTH